MSLLSLIDNSRTDKNTCHSYIPTYESLFNSKKESAKNILEIGIFQGGSIKLWNDYFTNATIYGLDIMNIKDVYPQIKSKPNIILHTSSDAYDTDFFNMHFLNRNIKFDVMIDDGPHTLDSMKTFITLYSNVLADDGILIVEDVQDIKWIDELKKLVSEKHKPYIEVYNLIKNKNRYDDLLFVINRNKKI